MVEEAPAAELVPVQGSMDHSAQPSIDAAALEQPSAQPTERLDTEPPAREQLAVEERPPDGAATVKTGSSSLHEQNGLAGGEPGEATPAGMSLSQAWAISHRMTPHNPPPAGLPAACPPAPDRPSHPLADPRAATCVGTGTSGAACAGLSAASRRMQSLHSPEPAFPTRTHSPAPSPPLRERAGWGRTGPVVVVCIAHVPQSAPWSVA